MNKTLLSLTLSIALLSTAPGFVAAKNPHTATLTLSSKSFIWAGPPALSHYTVWFCDGTTTEKIDINGKESEVSELEFDKQIAKVTAKGGTQWETKEQSCQEQSDEHEDEHKDDQNEEEKHEDISKGGPSSSNTTVPKTLADTGHNYALILALTGISLISLSLNRTRKNPRD